MRCSHMIMSVMRDLSWSPVMRAATLYTVCFSSSPHRLKGCQGKYVLRSKYLLDQLHVHFLGSLEWVFMGFNARHKCQFFQFFHNVHFILGKLSTSTSSSQWKIIYLK